MQIPKILDVVVGIAVMFFVLSTVASGIHEVFARALATRSKQLWRSLGAMLDVIGAQPDKTERVKTIAFGLNGDRDPRPSSQPTSAAPTTYRQRLFAHDLINGLDDTTQMAKTRLSHIEPDLFSRALLDIVSSGQHLDNTAAAKDAIDNLPESRLKHELEALVRHAGPDLGELRTDIGSWFETRMDGLSRAYRRRSRWWLFIIGLIVAVGVNVDALHVTNRFYRDDAMRTLIAAEAESLAADCEFTDGQPDDACKQKIDAAGDAIELPVWWSQDATVNGSTILGWVVAAVAISQGAPFWFDVLRRTAGFKRAAMSTT